MCANNKNSIALQKPMKQPRSFSYSREISAALLLKFLLLASLWWLFFKGHKLPVDGDMIAAKLFGEPPTVIHLRKNTERP